MYQASFCFAGDRGSPRFCWSAFAFHSERMLLLSNTVAGVRWGGEIWHTGQDSLYIWPSRFPHQPPPTDGRPAGASLYLNLSTAPLFRALCVQTKGTREHCGRPLWFSLSCEKWVGASRCCRRGDLWFHVVPSDWGGTFLSVFLFAVVSCDW